MNAVAASSPDKGVLCWIAARASDFWDFIDKRQIDTYAISVAILWGTVKIVEWAMHYANTHADKNGVEVAAVVAAVMTPYSLLQGAAVKFLFDARQKSFVDRSDNGPRQP